MLISELIKYKADYIEKPTKRIVQTYLDNRLYVPGGGFDRWYTTPKKYFKNGYYVCTIKENNNINGIAILNVNMDLAKIYEMWLPQSLKENEVLVGIIGYYINHEYRGKGYAGILAKKIENYFLKKNPKFRTNNKIPVVIGTGIGYIISKKYFNTIIPYNTNK